VPFSAPERRSHKVYVYFDNDAKVRAPGDALALIRRVEELMRESTTGADGPVPPETADTISK
jgi:uncharacterized protein YecE (DUF72 family)